MIILDHLTNAVSRLKLHHDGLVICISYVHRGILWTNLQVQIVKESKIKQAQTEHHIRLTLLLTDHYNVHYITRRIVNLQNVVDLEFKYCLWAI